MNLKQLGIVLLEKGDSFAWDWNEANGSLTKKSAYEAIVVGEWYFHANRWYLKLWKRRILFNIKCFNYIYGTIFSHGTICRNMDLWDWVYALCAIWMLIVLLIFFFHCRFFKKIWVDLTLKVSLGVSWDENSV